VNRDCLVKDKASKIKTKTGQKNPPSVRHKRVRLPRSEGGVLRSGGGAKSVVVSGADLRRKLLRGRKKRKGSGSSFLGKKNRKKKGVWEGKVVLAKTFLLQKPKKKVTEKRNFGTKGAGNRGE